MTIPKITWIYEAHESPAFHLGRDERFIDAISHHAGVAIDRLEGRLLELAPSGGFIILNAFGPREALAGCSPERWADLAPRLIPLDVSSSRIFDRLLEPLSLAAAVDAPTHLAWTRDPTNAQGTQGLFGLRAIGRVMGVAIDPGGSERYCRMSGPPLPQLLAEYLAALDESRRGDGLTSASPGHS